MTYNDNKDGFSLEEARDIADALVFLDENKAQVAAAEETVKGQRFHTWVGAGQRYFSKTTPDRAVRVAAWTRPEDGEVGVQVIVYGDYDHNWSNFVAPNYDEPLQALEAYYSMAQSLRLSA